MAPVTRRRAARLRWDQLWLPPEVLEGIILHALQTIIHDTLILAGSFGIRRAKPWQFHLRSTPTKRRNGTGTKAADPRQEIHEALRFRSILHISRVNRQYRSILERLLTRLLPGTLHSAELMSRLSYPPWEILSRKRPFNTETPILNALVSLKVIAACCMDMNIRGLRDRGVAQTLFETFTRIEAIGRSSIATSYLLHARLRIEVYQRLQSVNGGNLWSHAFRTLQISRGSTEWINKPLLRKVTDEVFFLGYLLYAGESTLCLLTGSRH